MGEAGASNVNGPVKRHQSTTAQPTIQNQQVKQIEMKLKTKSCKCEYEKPKQKRPPQLSEGRNKNSNVCVEVLIQHTNPK